MNDNERKALKIAFKKYADVIADGRLDDVTMAQMDDFRSGFIAALEYMSSHQNQWISVKDRLPELKNYEKYTGVLVVRKDYKQCSEALYGNGVFRFDYDRPTLRDVTYWQYLPEAPTDNQSKDC